MITTATATGIEPLTTIPESATERARILAAYNADPANQHGFIKVVSDKTGESKSFVSRVWNLQFGTGKYSRERAKRLRSALIREMNRWIRKSTKVAA